MKKERTIFLSDCQSFYASVEKAEHPEWLDKPVAVAGDPERRSGIILTACPVAKSYGVTTGEPLGESLKKCPDLVLAKPRMQHYINISLQITQIYEQFTDLVEPYSIDEQFLDVTGSQMLYGDAENIAKLIQKKILDETGVWVRIGISENKILAKIATDIFAKKNKSGIFTLPKCDIEKTMWPQPIQKMFGVGNRMNAHFARLGILTIGDLGSTPLPKLKQLFRARFGKQSDIQAEVLWRTANGLDDSPVSPNSFNTPPKSVGHMMTLPFDYINTSDINTILLEMTEAVCRDCRRKGYMGSVINVGCMCSPYDSPTGFSKQMKMPDPTNNTNATYSHVKNLFYKNWNGMPVRRVGVSLSSLIDDSGYQLTLFNDQIKSRALDKVTDSIKDRYGSAAIMRASSFTSAGQAKDRSEKIGGHFK